MLSSVVSSSRGTMAASDVERCSSSNGNSSYVVGHGRRRRIRRTRRCFFGCGALRIHRRMVAMAALMTVPCCFRRGNHNRGIFGLALAYSEDEQSLLLHQLIFPPNDMYDISNVYGANHLQGVHAVTSPSFFGAPYGGYSRCTDSRLAQLPLRLVGSAQFREQLPRGGDPDSNNQHNGNDNGDHDVKPDTFSDDTTTSTTPFTEDAGQPVFFNVRDAQGRLFTCRVYHEDEVHPSSKKDSIFNEAQLLLPLFLLQEDAYHDEEQFKSENNHDEPREEQHQLSQQQQEQQLHGTSNKNNNKSQLTSSTSPRIGQGHQQHHDKVSSSTLAASTTTSKGKDKMIQNHIGSDIRKGRIMKKERAIPTTTTATTITTEQFVTAVQNNEGGSGGDGGETDNGHKPLHANDESNARSEVDHENIGNQHNADKGQKNVNDMHVAELKKDEVVVNNVSNDDHNDENDYDLNREDHSDRSKPNGGNIVDDETHVTINTNDKESDRNTNDNNNNNVIMQRYKVTHEQIETLLLKELNGVCVQTHKGYWSYEWCYKETFKQFHVSAKTETFSSNVKHENWEKLAAESKNQKYAIVYSIESLIILGHYKSQNFQVAIISNGSGNSFDGDANSDDRLSVIVHQVYDDGDYCESSNKPRKVNVELRCCTKDEMSRLGIRYKKAVTQDDNGLQQQQRVTPKAFMVDIQEIPSMVCEYQATVCSPILCQEEIMSNDDDSYHNYGSMEKLLEKHYIESQLPTNAINNINEKESIRQILERALGNVCLQRNEGWWRYEICHTKRVRQFHTETTIDGLTGKVSIKIDGDYSLGYFDPTMNQYLVRDEIHHVQNSGSTDAVYEQEYIHGDVCTGNDVAGSVTATESSLVGGIQRSTTVRFLCGKSLELFRIDEDSSCHYVMWVHVPDLCHHFAFQAPVVKEQIIKCLPVIG